VSCGVALISRPTTALRAIVLSRATTVPPETPPPWNGTPRVPICGRYVVTAPRLPVTVVP
jgi:hypothetical protein